MKARLKFRHYFLFFILAIALLFAGFENRHPVQAQTETVLAVSPSVTNFFINGASTAQVQVVINDVTLLNAFDITLTYDPDVALVTSWSAGGFLSNLFYLMKVNNPGYLRIACTQLATPGVSGSGVLLNLTFSAVGSGSTPLTFSSVALSNSSSQSIPATLQDGTVNAGFIAFELSGAIYAQGQADRSGIPVGLGVGPIYRQGPLAASSTPDYGLNLSFSSIPSGDSYLFTTTMPRYLNIDAAQGKTVTVSGGDVGLSPLELLAGDAVVDNAITTADLDAIRDVFETVGAGLNADVNFDGLVNIQDLALAGGNLGLTGADAYAGWQP